MYIIIYIMHFISAKQLYIKHVCKNILQQTDGSGLSQISQKSESLHDSVENYTIQNIINIVQKLCTFISPKIILKFVAKYLAIDFIKLEADSIVYNLLNMFVK